MSLDPLIYPQGMVYRLPAMTYMHVLDTFTQAIRLETGPKTFVCLSGQKVIYGPAQFIVVPPQQYVTIGNPCVLDKDGKVVLDKNGQAVLQHGDIEIRTERSPFPLYPGEKLEHAVKPLPTVAINSALRMEAIRDIIAPDGKIIHKVGEEWLEIGPKVLIPHPGARIVSTVSNFVIAPNEALHIRAQRDLMDFEGKKRIAGEEYLVRMVGSYLPLVDEQVIGKVTATVLTPKVALMMRAKQNFKDQFGKQRKIGEEWLVTVEDTESFIPSVEEMIIMTVHVTTLTSRQWCIIENPVDNNGKNQFGIKEIRRGPATFFLQPGEVLKETQEVTVLQEDSALDLMAIEQFEDVDGNTKKMRKPGEVWRLVGPKEYWIPLEVSVLRRISPVLKIPSLKIYIFDIGKLIAMGLGVLAFFVLFIYILFKL